MTVEELLEKAKDQRQRGRLDEALISARHATRLEPKNADAFWQVALCELDVDAAGKAVESLEKVTALAPQFAYGWTKLGLAHQKTGNNDQAKECFERATELSPDQVEALIALTQIYERDKQPDDEMRVLLALEGQVDLSPYNLNRLGILYYNEKKFYPALRYYQQVAAKASDAVGFFNLGLVFNAPEMRQNADAVDAWRRALRRQPGFERATTMIAGLLPRLKELRLKVMATGETALYPDQWYSQYVNPLELLGVDANKALDEIDTKSIQRAKKVLFHEIEIEDGLVEWMPGLVIDRSRAISLCDELNSATKLRYHHHVFQNNFLLAFLQHGDLRHFLVDESTSPLETIELLESDPEGFGAWLSPIFAAQLNFVLTKTIELLNLPGLIKEIDHQALASIECILSGRRWVRPEDVDKCFEGAHRLIDRLLEPLQRAAQRSEKTKPVMADVETLLSAGHLREILGVLPVAFYAEQQVAAKLVRDISVNTHNHHGDADLAKSILLLSQAFATHSPSLQDQIRDDLATLEDRIKAECKDEAHVNFGDKVCNITRKGVRFGQTFISVDDARTLRWGSITTRSGVTTSIAFKLVVGDLRGTVIKIEWTTTQNHDAQLKYFKDLTNAVVTYLLPPVFAVIRKDLDSEKRVPIGGVELTKEGVALVVPGWFTSKTIVCPWSRVKSEIVNGHVIISDTSNPKATANLPLAEIDNAVALHLLAQRT